jgi:hypothetical protein
MEFRPPSNIGRSHEEQRKLYDSLIHLYPDFQGKYTVDTIAVGYYPKYKKVSTIADLNTLDPEEITKGYLYGLEQDATEPLDATRAFWHGWRNARIDRGFLPADEASAALAAECVKSRHWF